MSYSSIITTLGAAKFAAAISSGTAITFSSMKVGDGNGNDIPEPLDPSVTDLVRTVYTAAVNSIEQDTNNPNNFIVEMIVPTDVGGWTVREVGVFDDAGSLIVYASFPPCYKPIVDEGAAREMLIRIVVSVADPGTINITVNPSLIIATRDWVIDNYSIATLIPGGTTNQILAKNSNTDGDYKWVDPSTAVAIVEVIEENQTLSASQTVVNMAVAGTDNAALYINGIRLRDNEWVATDADTATLNVAATGGEKITIVQNDPVAGIGYLRISRLLGEIYDAGVSACNTARANLRIVEPANILLQVLDLLYPVGEIKISRRAGAPNTWAGIWAGFGTWTPYGPGRALVSSNPADPDFQTVDLQGGEKAHKLIIAELPSHQHRTDATEARVTNSGNHTHAINPPSISTSSNGTHTHTYGHNDGQNHTAPTSGAGEDWRDGPATPNKNITDGAGNHSHSVNIPSFASAAAGDHVHTVTVPTMATDLRGGDLAHNNLQPYTVVNVWKRTA